MNLTPFERWSLVNQYKILAKVDPENTGHYGEAIEALERGYEPHYRSLAAIEEHVMTAEECTEVQEILAMFDNVRLALEKMPEQTQTDVANLTFLGFGGNDKEVKQMEYARYFCGLSGGQFQYLEKREFNSHSTPMLETYRAKLAAWNLSADRYSLTSPDLGRIAAAH